MWNIFSFRHQYIPDAQWNVKNILSKADIVDTLFSKFREYLDGKGLSFIEGKIINASFVEAPNNETSVRRTSR